MSDEGFLRRWSRLKADPAAAQPAAAPAPAPQRLEAATVVPTIDRHPSRARQPDGAAPAPALPTLDDVARLRSDSDFSAFVSKGVDKDVRRLAMKKLFSDPHFNLVDRLDVYMDDYNKPSPMSEAMLAALHHTKNLFAPLAADKEAAAAAAAAEAGEGVAATASINPDPGGAAIAGSDPAAEPSPDAAAPAQFEQTQSHGAAAGGVLQQTPQGKA
jgi:hypothetical protein